MKIKQIVVEVEEYKSPQELKDQDLELLNLAEENIHNAYAPYSHYRVGAALRLSNGKVITGNNQENVAYPSGLCAERVAMYYAKSQYPDEKVEAIAIAARADDFIISDAVAPCGSCRQAMAEYQTQQNSPIRVIMKGEKGPVIAVKGIESLLPLLFHAEELKRKK